MDLRADQLGDTKPPARCRIGIAFRGLRQSIRSEADRESGRIPVRIGRIRRFQPTEQLEVEPQTLIGDARKKPDDHPGRWKHLSFEVCGRTVGLLDNFWKKELHRPAYGRLKPLH